MVDFSQSINQPEDVMLRQVEGESVLLNLATDSYFTLNEVGTQIYLALCSSATIQQAYEKMLEMYDVDAAVLKTDMQVLVEQLVDQELVSLV